MRSPVTVVVPFRGDAAEAADLLTILERLDLDPADEVIVVDNSPCPTVSQRGTRVRVVHARKEQTSYYARNFGASMSATEWLLFLDADTRPRSENLLDAYFRPPPDDRCGAMAGAVIGSPSQRGVLPAHARSRRLLDQVVALSHPHRPFGLTANLAVRRQAWKEVGGFCEGIRSGGDQDFCWRLQEKGWSVSYRADAVVEHRHRERLAPVVRQFLRYGAGSAWLARRHGLPANQRPRMVSGLVRCAAGMGVWALAGQRERAVFKALDAIVLGAVNAGFLLENRPKARANTRVSPTVVAVIDEFPRDGVDLAVGWIEARRRPLRPQADLVRERRIAYAEDDGYGHRVRDVVWWAVRHPRDLFRVAREERGGVLHLAPRLHRMRTGARVLRVDESADRDAAVLARSLGATIERAPP